MDKSDEKLDAVLTTLNKSYEDYYHSGNSDKNIKIGNELKLEYLNGLDIATSIGLIDGKNDIQLILDFLCDEEKLIYRKSFEYANNKFIIYKILWKGKVFIENGGYKKEREIKLLNEQKSEQVIQYQTDLQDVNKKLAKDQLMMITKQTDIQQAVQELTRWITIGTVVAAVAAIIAAIYYIHELIKDWDYDFSNHNFFWFSMGVIMGMLLILLIQLKLKSKPKLE